MTARVRTEISQRLFALISAILFTCYSIAKADDLDPIEGYLSSAESKANSIVSNAGAQGRSVVMEAGLATINAIGNFKSAYASSLKLSSRELSGQQAELFGRIQQAMAELEASSEKTTDNLQSLTDTLADATTNIPLLSKDIPRVRRVSPIFFSDKEVRQGTQEVVVKGIGLANGSPVFAVNGHELRLAMVADNELRIRVPASGQSGQFPERINGVLRLFERKSRFLWFPEYIPKEYRIELSVYADKIGTIVLTPRVGKEETEVREVQTDASQCLSHDGVATVPVSVLMADDWEIVAGSISFHETATNYGSHAISSATPKGFTAILTCSGFKGGFMSKSHQGIENGYFTYKMSKKGTVLVNAESVKRDLSWGESFTISSLPSNTESVILDLDSPFGDHMSIVDNGDGAFASMNFNKSTETATINGKRIEDALRR